MTGDFSGKYTLEAVLSELEESVQPRDLEEAGIFTTEEHPLFLTGSTSIKDLTPVQVLLHPPKPTRRGCPKNNVWDVDVAMSAPGYFDEAGNFVLQPSKKPVVKWFIMRNETIEGPFTLPELREKASNGLLAGTKMRRDLDASFVASDDILERFPDLKDTKGIAKFIFENQVKSPSEETECFYRDVITRDKPYNKKDTKLSNFLQTNSVEISVDSMIRGILGKRMEEAVGVLSQMTGLSVPDASTLIYLIVEASDRRILADVDKDGFTVSQEAKRMSGSRRRRI